MVKLIIQIDGKIFNLYHLFFFFSIFISDFKKIFIIICMGIISCNTYFSNIIDVS